MRLALKVVGTSSPGVLVSVLLAQSGVVSPWLGAVLAALSVVLAMAWQVRGLSDIARLIDDLAAGRPVDRAQEGDDEVGRLGAGTNALAQRMEHREHRISEELKRQAAILASMSEGILALDSRRRLLMANEAAAQLLGVDGPLQSGQSLSDITRMPAILGAVDDCLIMGRRVEDEGRVVGMEPERVLHIAASPAAQDGEVQRLCVLVLRDITELRHLEQVRRDFVANVSHELKTPLTSVQAYLEAVLEEPEMEDDQRVHFLGKVARNTERITAIVSDLLDLARLEGSVGLRSEPLDFGKLVSACVNRCREGATDAGVMLAVDLSEEAMPFRGDMQEISGAVSNLLDNAIKYTPAEGHVRVTAGSDATSVWLEVEDDGPGIAIHDQERIFERFYRVDKDRSRALGGTGLGLSIVRNVARQHGGRVSVTSRAGEGSTFRLVLPREDVAV